MLGRTENIQLVARKEPPSLDGPVVLAAQLPVGWVDLGELGDLQRAVVIDYARTGRLREGYALTYEYA